MRSAIPRAARAGPQAVQGRASPSLTVSGSPCLQGLLASRLRMFFAAFAPLPLRAATHILCLPAAQTLPGDRRVPARRHRRQILGTSCVLRSLRGPCPPLRCGTGRSALSVRTKSPVRGTGSPHSRRLRTVTGQAGPRPRRGTARGFATDIRAGLPPCRPLFVRLRSLGSRQAARPAGGHCRASPRTKKLRFTDIDAPCGAQSREAVCLSAKPVSCAAPSSPPPVASAPSAVLPMLRSGARHLHATDRPRPTLRFAPCPMAPADTQALHISPAQFLRLRDCQAP